MVNAVYFNQGTAKTWLDSGGDYAITASSLGIASGRVGARGDLGAWPHATLYRWYMEAQWAATPAALDRLELYLALWDNDTGPADPYGGVASTDSALTSVTQAYNMLFAGAIVCETAAVGPFGGGGIINIPARYVSPVVINRSATKALVASGTFPFALRLTPIYPEVQ